VQSQNNAAMVNFPVVDVPQSFWSAHMQRQETDVRPRARKALSSTTANLWNVPFQIKLCQMKM
jgi:hypothetical protein